jgi:hypothetical protein
VRGTVQPSAAGAELWPAAATGAINTIAATATTAATHRSLI